MNRLQLSLLDLFWATGLVACMVAANVERDMTFAWIGLSCVLVFVWRRPVLLRFWTVAVAGIGSGLFMEGAYGKRALYMDSGDLLAWGSGMLVGSVLAFILFDIRKPPEKPGDGKTAH
jgi:hypothetical protein